MNFSLSSIDSSSSGEMEQSKPPKDVLGLGRHLVRELKLKDRGDTLGLWMAHHIADLIKAAEKEGSPVKRRKAAKEATETILKIWEHRESLPSYAYPLALYDDLFRVLDRLQPSDNPFRYGHDLGARTDQLAERLFYSLSSLIICLLLMKPLSLHKAETIDETVLEALSEEERKVWEALQKWSEIFGSESDPKQSAGASEAQTELPVVDLKEMALNLMTEIKDSVDELRTEFEKKDTHQKGLAPDNRSPAIKKARTQGAKRK